MGKSLIIKGADFSANAIPFILSWYNNYALQGNKAVAESLSAILLTLESVEELGLSGKQIDAIKLYSTGSSTISIGTAETAAITEGSELVFNILDSEEYSVVAGENTINLKTPIIIQGNQTIFMSVSTQLRYNSNDTDHTNGWHPITKISSGRLTDPDSNVTMPVMFGYRT